MADFDLAIVGGGINGAGIARDAAGRGLRVLLVEQNDLASGTSSASTKLIHGGLRYLEQGWFRLVREALIEREVMLRMAPHLIRPMRFVLPPDAGPASAPGCCGWGCSSTIISAGAKSCRRPAPSISPTIRSARRSSGATNAASNIPIAGRTTRGWWCSTRSMPPSAAPRSAPARAASGRSAAAEWRLVLDARGRRDRRDRARPGQRRRALGRAVRGERAARPDAVAGAARSRAATSWCGACSTTIAATSSRTRDGRVRVRAAVRAAISR